MMSVSRRDKQQLSPEDENFISRWSRRKQQTVKDPAATQQETPAADAIADKPLLTDADMPSIESLTEDSDYSGFLSPKVSEALRRQALRKLFHSPVFNLRDGLDDYDGVYTEFEKLGDIVTADMRHQLEREAQRRAQQIVEAESAEKDQGKQVATETQIVSGDSELDPSLDDVDDAEVEL